MGRAARIGKGLEARRRAQSTIPLHLYDRALDALRVGNRSDAIALLREVLLRNERHPSARFNLAVALREEGSLDEAIDQFAAVIARASDHVDAWVNMAEALRRAGRACEALAACDRAVELKPRHAEAYMIRGVVRHGMDDIGGALADLRRSTAEDADATSAYQLLGKILMATSAKKEALAALKEASRIDPNDAQTHRLIGDVQDQMGCRADSFAAYQKALEIDPHDSATYSNLSGMLCRTNLLALVLSVTEVGLKLAPDLSHLHFNRAIALEKLGRSLEALQSYGQALRCDPASGRTILLICHLKRQLCDWNGLAAADDVSHERTYKSGKAAPPFSILANTRSLSDILACNRLWSSKIDGGAAPLSGPLSTGHRRRSGRLRIGYLSADFHMHATAALIAEVFELHDKALFETFGYSIGPADEGAMRCRLVGALDHFHDVTDLSHDAAAALIHAHEIDILIDLKGYTFQSRPEIMARRPAPVQVNFLGYPSTMGADFIDYVIGDPVVTPMEHARFYSEKIVQLPHSYQPNDRKRPIADVTPSRAECGLPAEGFVFCCFNAASKITPHVFDLWMGLLREVPGSVLWLYATDAAVPANLWREAIARGVAPERLVFAKKLPVPAHLSRMRRGDLFLDTSPYGAHTTASEALWAGLPVVTMLDETFASRVAASLLTAVGLPELIATSWGDYIGLARELAGDPRRLVDLRSRLRSNLPTAPLFDSARYTRNYENALARMAALRDAGEAPRSFAIEDV